MCSTMNSKMDTKRNSRLLVGVQYYVARINQGGCHWEPTLAYVVKRPLTCARKLSST